MYADDYRRPSPRMESLIVDQLYYLSVLLTKLSLIYDVLEAPDPKLVYVPLGRRGTV